MQKLLEGWIESEGAVVSSPDDSLALYFDIIEDHSVSLQSQITDNWLEDNSVISDHIANQPISITLRGLSAELVYETASASWFDNLGNKMPTPVKNTYNKLSPLTSLYPPVSNITQLAKNVINYVESSFNRYKKIIKAVINPSTRRARLEKIYGNLHELRNSKDPLTVKTPYGYFDNMYIQSLVFRQGDKNFITDIEITLKQIYFSSVQTININKENRENCNFLQRQEVENHGITQGKVPGGGKSSGGNSDEGNSYNLLWKLRIDYDKYL